jgi:DNA-binding Xre family transcriptional regulator
VRLNIKDKLAEKKMTRYELAKRIGITYPTVSRLLLYVDKMQQDKEKDDRE